MTDAAALEAPLRRLVEDAAAAWPEWALPPEDFIAYVAERLPADRPCAEGLATLHATDLYLACACAHGDPAAIAAFDEGFVPNLCAALRSASLPGVAVDDLLQSVRERLLVGDGTRPPRIREYAGRGPLASWLRVVGLRMAVSVHRRARKETPATSQRLEHLLEAEHDPEIGYLKDLYRDGFKAAMQEALARLDTRDRTVLRYHYLDGLTLEEIGTFYRVHRATVARWIAKAREQVLGDMVAILRERLPISRQEFESLVRLLRSQVDLSVQRLFADD